MLKTSCQIGMSRCDIFMETLYVMIVNATYLWRPCPAFYRNIIFPVDPVLPYKLLLGIFV